MLQIKVQVQVRKCRAAVGCNRRSSQSRVQAEIEYVTDMMQIAETGLYALPGLMIDNKMVQSGQVWKLAVAELMRK